MSIIAHTHSARQANLYRTWKLAAVVYAVLALGGIGRGEEKQPQRTQGTQGTQRTNCQRIPAADRAILARVAAEYQLFDKSEQLLRAIYLAERGGPGREMGVLTPAAQRLKGDHAKSLELQARWAAGTIKRRYTGDLAAFAARWAPVGAANDPQGLNRHWLPNVRRFMAEE